LIPVGIGAWCAHGALSAVSGYVAGYAFFIVWAFAVLIGTSGILLLIVQRTRRAGILGIGASVVLLASFYLVFFVGRSMGVNEWPGDRLISIPPVAPK
jgi:hypothetical protein